MDEIEYARVYQELAAILNEFNLGWVAQQVADTVEIGKTIEERSPKRKTPLLKIENYTAKEQLLLLIDAIEQATVNTSEIEDEIAYFLKVESETSPLGTKLHLPLQVLKEPKQSILPLILQPHATNRRSPSKTCSKNCHQSLATTSPIPTLKVN